MTVPVLIVSHGSLARELLDSARAIAGPASQALPIHALCFDWQADAGATADEVAATARRLEREHGKGVLILTQMFGDTPSNNALRLTDVGTVAVITGANLPMVLSLCCDAPELPLPDLADWVWWNGRRGIQLAATGVDRSAT